MDLQKIIAKAQKILSDASVGEQAGDLEEVYNQMDKLQDLLIEEFIPMEHP